MKMIAMTAAALLSGSAAFAQTAPSSGSMTPSTGAAGTAAGQSMSPGAPMRPPSSALTPDAGTAGDSMGSSTSQRTTTGNNTTTTTTLTQRDGNWYNGDRRATRTQITQYRKTMKKRPS